jgi:hypothetical protein
MVTLKKENKRNHETIFANNLILKDKIEKKINKKIELSEDEIEKKKEDSRK